MPSRTALRTLNTVRFICALARGKVLTYRIRLMGGHVGRRLSAGPGVSAGQVPHSGWQIGDDVVLGRGVILDVSPGAQLVLGDRTKVMHYSLVATESSVVIGEDTQIAEHCSIRDMDHTLDSPGTIAAAPLVSTPIAIGADVWIGRGVAVLRGARIGDGTVVGANSVVTSRELGPNSIYVGAPAHLLRRRSTNN